MTTSSGLVRWDWEGGVSTHSASRAPYQGEHVTHRRTAPATERNPYYYACRCRSTLPLQFMQARRLDVLAEMARLRVLHEETHARVHGTARTAAEDRRRLAAAKKACKEAVKKFRISRGRKR